jgi:hypothetical protein
MKKTVGSKVIVSTLTLLVSLLLSAALKGQEPATGSSGLPDNVHKIVSLSCMPCHSSRGGMMSRSKLNFDEWSTYSADKQKKKAEQMYKELKKDKMPPKTARENNPAIIPTKEQKKIIKAWSESIE